MVLARCLVALQARLVHLIDRLEQFVVHPVVLLQDLPPSLVLSEPSTPFVGHRLMSCHAHLVLEPVPQLASYQMIRGLRYGLLCVQYPDYWILANVLRPLRTRRLHSGPRQSEQLREESSLGLSNLPRLQALACRGGQ